MFSVNQVRHAIVANTVSAETTLAAVKSTYASDGVGNKIYVCSADGKQYSTKQSKIAFKQINSKGLITTSEVIDTDKIDYVKVIGYLPAVPKVATIAPGTIANSSYYEVKVEFANWGSLSAEDTYTRIASYTTAASGDDTEVVVDKLIQELAKTLGNEQPNTGARFTYTLKDSSTVSLPTNPYFTITKATPGVSTTKLVLTEKAQDYITGIKQNRSLSWKASINSSSADSTTSYTGGSKGIGAGKDVKDLEWFSKGYRADQYRGMGYPSNFEESYVADIAAGYNVLELGYYFQGEGENVQKSHKTLTLFVKNDDATFASNLVAKLGTMIGISLFAPLSGTGLLGGAVSLPTTATGRAVTFSTLPSGTYTSPVAGLPSWITSATFAGAILTITPVASTSTARSAILVITNSLGVTYNLLVTQAAV